MISLQKRGLPAPLNHQTPVSTKQVPDLVEITTVLKHVIHKKVFLHRGKNLIRADQSLAMLLHAARRAVVHSPGEARKADRKGLLANNLVKGKAILREERCHIQANQLQKADPKEVPIIIRVVENLLKGNLSVNQASKAVKDLRTENSAVAHQKIQDISHFVNRLIHLIINHHSELNAARKINHCGPGRNLQKSLA